MVEASTLEILPWVDVVSYHGRQYVRSWISWGITCFDHHGHQRFAEEKSSKWLLLYHNTYTHSLFLRTSGFRSLRTHSTYHPRALRGSSGQRPLVSRDMSDSLLLRHIWIFMYDIIYCTENLIVGGVFSLPWDPRNSIHHLLTRAIWHWHLHQHLHQHHHLRLHRHLHASLHNCQISPRFGCCYSCVAIPCEPISDWISIQLFWEFKSSHSIVKIINCIIPGLIHHHTRRTPTNRVSLRLITHVVRSLPRGVLTCLSIRNVRAWYVHPGLFPAKGYTWKSLVAFLTTDDMMTHWHIEWIHIHHYRIEELSTKYSTCVSTSTTSSYNNEQISCSFRSSSFRLWKCKRFCSLH